MTAAEKQRAYRARKAAEARLAAADPMTVVEVSASEMAALLDPSLAGLPEVRPQEPAQIEAMFDRAQADFDDRAAEVVFGHSSGPGDVGIGRMVFELPSTAVVLGALSEIEDVVDGLFMAKPQRVKTPERSRIHEALKRARKALKGE